MFRDSFDSQESELLFSDSIYFAFRLRPAGYEVSMMP